LKKKIRDNPTLQSSILSIETFPSWNQIESCKGDPVTIETAVNAKINASVEEIWKIISNISDCRWVVNCFKSYVTSEIERTLFFSNELVLPQQFVVDEPDRTIFVSMNKFPHLFANGTEILFVRQGIDSNHSIITSIGSYYPVNPALFSAARTEMLKTLEKQYLHFLPNYFEKNI